MVFGNKPMLFGINVLNNLAKCFKPKRAPNKSMDVSGNSDALKIIVV